MPWQINSDRPVYIQLMEEIKIRIITKHYALGEKLPSVRDLAQEASVNPNTMQKALSELEQSGLLSSQRTSGRFVTDDSSLIEEMKQALAKNITAEFKKKMYKLGFSDEDINSLLNKQ